MDAEAVLLVDHHQAEVAEIDALLEDGVGADDEVDVAGGEPGDGLLALAAALAAGEHGDAHAGGVGKRGDGAGVLADEQLGRRHQRGLGAALDNGRGGEQGDHGLARADVALEQAEHALRLGEVGGDLGERVLLAAGEIEGEGGDDRLGQAAVALPGRAGRFPLAVADDGERKLGGEQFVIGEPDEMRAGRFEVGRLFGIVRGAEGRGEGRPLLAVDHRRIEPLGQRREAVDRLADGADQDFAGEPGAQRVDRLDQRQGGEVGLADDVVGMDHRRPAAEPFHLAADIEGLADREGPGQPVVVGVEEGEGDLPRLVMGEDLVGDTAVARRRLLVAVDPDPQRDDGAGGGKGDLGAAAAVDDRRRQVEQEVTDPRHGIGIAAAKDATDGLGELVADAVEAGDGSKKRVEERRAHEVSGSAPAIADRGPAVERLPAFGAYSAGFSRFSSYGWRAGLDSRNVVTSSRLSTVADDQMSVVQVASV